VITTCNAVNDDSSVIETFEIEIDGIVYRVPGYCPHRNGKLIHGFVNRKIRTISCPLHRSLFSLETGEQISGPNCDSLKIQKYSKNG
jgi:nitrite reductase/ring-hydroxylating ferredoxin subunit